MIRKVLTVLIVLLFFLIEKPYAHPVHVSVSNIEFGKDSLIVSVKVFRDDFLLALQHNFGQVIDLAHIEKNKEWIDQYINSSFGIILNNSDSLKLKRSNIEYTEEAIWIFYEARVDRVRNLKIFNTLLLDIYFDQTNLVIVNYMNRQSGYRFNYKTTERNLRLK